MEQEKPPLVAWLTKGRPSASVNVLGKQLVQEMSEKILKDPFEIRAFSADSGLSTTAQFKDGRLILMWCPES